VAKEKGDEGGKGIYQVTCAKSYTNDLVGQEKRKEGKNEK